MTKIPEGELYFMFVFTFKASTLKYIGVMSLCAVAIVLTVALVPSESLTVGMDNRVIETATQRNAGDFKTPPRTRRGSHRGRPAAPAG